MEKTSERRRQERFACGSPLKWAYFNKAEFHNARMCNFSHAGVCFESAEALVPGAAVVVRLEGYRVECVAECSDQSECPWPRSIALGEVKWCRGANDGGPHLFGAGVRFHLPV
ncbi:MAG: PilZ domain-containing protein [Desulfobacterales bacterium]